MMGRRRRRRRRRGPRLEWFLAEALAPVDTELVLEPPPKMIASGDLLLIGNEVVRVIAMRPGRVIEIDRKVRGEAEWHLRGRLVRLLYSGR